MDDAKPFGAGSANLQAQLASFSGFLDLAHQMGASAVHDVDVGVEVHNQDERAVLYFSHGDFPGARFGYHAKPSGEDDRETLWLAEEVATGALHRLASLHPPPAGQITWLQLHGELLRRYP